MKNNGEMAKKLYSIFCGIGRIERGKGMWLLENGNQGDIMRLQGREVTQSLNLKVGTSTSSIN